MANSKKLIQYNGEEIVKVDVPTSVNNILVREICTDVFDGVETVTIDTYANDIPGSTTWGADNVVWLKEPRCEISFDANGGSGTMTKMPANVGMAFKIPECKFRYVGQGFVGWAVDSVTGNVVQPGTLYAFAGNTTLYALWTNNWELPVQTGNKLSCTQFETIAQDNNKIGVQ